MFENDLFYYNKAGRLDLIAQAEPTKVIADESGVLATGSSQKQRAVFSTAAFFPHDDGESCIAERINALVKNVVSTSGDTRNLSQAIVSAVTIYLVVRDDYPVVVSCV
jgi:hypothetical protein